MMALATTVEKSIMDSGTNTLRPRKAAVTAAKGVAVSKNVPGDGQVEKNSTAVYIMHTSSNLPAPAKVFANRAAYLVFLISRRTLQQRGTQSKDFYILDLCQDIGNNGGMRRRSTLGVANILPVLLVEGREKKSRN